MFIVRDWCLAQCWLILSTSVVRTWGRILLGQFLVAGLNIQYPVKSFTPYLGGRRDRVPSDSLRKSYKRLTCIICSTFSTCVSWLALTENALENFRLNSCKIVSCDFLSFPVAFVLQRTCDFFGTLVTPRRSCTCTMYWCAYKSPQKASTCFFCCWLLPNVVLSLSNCSIMLLLSLWRTHCCCFCL